jgi:hypothetical protein
VELTFTASAKHVPQQPSTSPTRIFTISQLHSNIMSNSRLLDPVDAFFGPAAMAQKRRDGARSSSRRRAKGHYKKLLWFKQPCMMNPRDFALAATTKCVVIDCLNDGSVRG